MTKEITVETELKLFSEYDKKEQVELIEKNYVKLSEYLICWESEWEHLNEFIEEKLKTLGLEKLEYEVDSYNRVTLYNSVLSHNLIDTFNLLIEVENEKEETKSMLEKAKSIYEWVREVSDDQTEYILEIYNRKVNIEDNINFNSPSEHEEEIKERLVKYKNATKNPKLIKEITDIQLKFSFSKNDKLYDKIDIVLEELLNEKRKEFKPFIEYVQKKIMEIKSSIERMASNLGSYEDISERMEEDVEIKFDKNGCVIFL